MRLPEEKKPSFFGGLMGGITSPPKPPHVPDEEYDAMRSYVKEFEGQLAELHKFLERLVRRRKDLASSLAELGLTLITLAGHEQQSGDPDSDGASKACTDLGSCCDHLSIALQHQANDEAKKALMVVDDWLRVVRGAKTAIKARGAAAGSTVQLRFAPHLLHPTHPPLHATVVPERALSLRPASNAFRHDPAARTVGGCSDFFFLVRAFVWFLRRQTGG